MSHADNMVLVVLGVTSSLKCLVLHLHVGEERSVASFPGSSQTHRNGYTPGRGKIVPRNVMLHSW